MGGGRREEGEERKGGGRKRREEGIRWREEGEKFGKKGGREKEGKFCLREARVAPRMEDGNRGRWEGG